jgi:signal transduction histidine kinase
MTLVRDNAPIHASAMAGAVRTAGKAADAGAMADGGKAACLRLFTRLQAFAPAFWLALPAAHDGHGDGDAVLDALLAGASAAAAGAAPAYPAIVAEAGRARRHGVREATAPALLLLAAVGLGQDRRRGIHHEVHCRGALQLGATALALAERQGPRQFERARALHAALVLPYDAASGRAADTDHVGMLATAVRARHAGRHLDALAGFESAGTGASRDGLHWPAALAWEQAALLAGDNGLGAAMQHYRRLALASYGQAGASGRVDALRRAWGEDSAAAEQAERERILRAGSIGEIGLSIAHEVNQPLAAISLHAAAARKWLRRPQPDIERALASLLLISAAGRHAGDIVRSVQRLAARQDTEMANVPVDQTIADTLQLLQRPLRKHGIEIDLDLGLGECIIQANRVQLQQVVTNLLVNAIEALSGGRARVAGDDSAVARRIHVQSRRVGTGEVEISVADNGPGIAQQHRDRVFGSLFSTKPNSTGMGLSISLAIVRAHGGHIGYEPGEPHGACFRFRLPVHARPDRQAGYNPSP